MILNFGIVGEIWLVFFVIKFFKIILFFLLLVIIFIDLFNWKWFRCFDGKFGNFMLLSLVFKVSDFNFVVGLYNICIGFDLGILV